MMKTFIPHFEILPSEQMKLWPKLSPCKELGFVLYGGTAIALQLGHRSSIDFDFFSALPLDERKEKTMLEKFEFLKNSKLLQKEPDTRTYMTNEGVKLSFFGSIRFGRVGEPLTTDDGVLQVASLDDLFAIKLAVLTQRVEAKDYKDIAAMLKHGMVLEKGLSCASALYGGQFLPTESLKAMTYFHGGDLEELQICEKKILISAVSNLQIHEIPKIKIVSDIR